MRGDPVELLEAEPRDRARWLAARTGLDATAIWEWGVVSSMLRKGLVYRPSRATLAFTAPMFGVNLRRRRG